MGILLHDYDPQIGTLDPAAEMQAHRAWYRFQAFVFIVLGATIALAPVMTLLSTPATAGSLLLVAAFVHLMSGFQYRTYRTLHAISGFSMGIIGGVILFWPALSVAGFIYAAAAILIIEAGVQFYLGYSLQAYRRGGWFMASGLIAFAMGLALFLMTTESALAMVPYFVGALMVLYGIALIRAAAKFDQSEIE